MRTLDQVEQDTQRDLLRAAKDELADRSAGKKSLVARAERYGFLRTPCVACGQKMLVPRSGRQCLNCARAT